MLRAHSESASVPIFPLVSSDVPEPFQSMPDRLLSKNGNVNDFDIPDHVFEIYDGSEVDDAEMPGLEGDDDHVKLQAYMKVDSKEEEKNHKKTKSRNLRARRAAKRCCTPLKALQQRISEHQPSQESSPSPNSGAALGGTGPNREGCHSIADGPIGEPYASGSGELTSDEADTPQSGNRLESQ